MEVLSEEKRKMVEAHIPFAHKLAYKFHSERKNIDLDREEYESAAVVGLCEAAKNFDPEASNSFSTFSYLRIRGAMYELMQRSYGISRSYFSELTNEDDTSEKRLPYRFTNDVRELSNMGVLLRECGLELKLTGAGDSVELSYSDCFSPEKQASIQESASLLKELVQNLPRQQRRVVELHYFSDLSYREMSDLLGGMSKSWISRVHKQAVEALREMLDRRNQQSLNDVEFERIH